MTFAGLKTFVANETGLDTTTDATILGTWVNAAYKRICGIDNWPWLLKNVTLQTVADITTGTVSINAGSTSLTFSSGPAASVATNYMIQFTDVSDDWYFISSHTAASTSATLANAFNGTSNYTAGTYICRKVFYSLASTTDRIVDVRQARTKSKLGAVDVRTFDRYLPDPTATGDPLYYYITGVDSSNAWQIGLYPIPSAVENLQIRYLQIPADLTGTDVPVMPEKFHDAIAYGALYMFGHAYIDDTRLASAKARFEESLTLMRENYNPVPDQMTILQPWDSRPRRMLGRLNYPPNYPEYWR